MLLTGVHDDHANALALGAALALGGGRLPELYTFTSEPSPPRSLADFATEEEEEEVSAKLAEEARILEKHQRPVLMRDGPWWHYLWR